MADRNQNQGLQSWQQRQRRDWNQNRNRFNQQQNDFNQNREDYGNTGYGYSQGGGMRGDRYRQEMENQGNYNDENRYDYDRDYENTQYGTSGTYGYKGSNYGSGYNQGGYSGRTGYGNMGEGNDYRRRNWGRNYENRGNYNEYSKGDQYRNYAEGNYGRGIESDYYANMHRGESQNYRNEQQNMGMQDRNWWDRTRDEVSSWFGDDDAERRRNMDKYYGGHRGHGPKNYHRSEERIREDICDRLTDDDMLDATDIDIEVKGHEVVLTGTVNNRMQKRRAEDLVEAVSGVQNVENRIRVQQPPTMLSNMSTMGQNAANEIH